jgi:hypothetical protein
VLHDATLRSRAPLQARIPPETKALTVVHQERDLLRRELEAAQVREQAALEREQAAREREALLLCIVEQVQQNQCLLDIPRSTPPAALSELSPSADPHVPRGDMRFGSACGYDVGSMLNNLPRGEITRRSLLERVSRRRTPGHRLAFHGVHITGDNHTSQYSKTDFFC